MAEIAELADEFGSRYVLTLLGHHKIASLKGVADAPAFRPDILHSRHDNLIGPIRRNRLHPLPQNDLRRSWELQGLRATG